MYKVKLSILVMVYNHENYISEALDSIKKQNKSFSYEVLVGEDCSTDRTREILRNYNAVELDNFQVFYHQSNMGVMANLVDLCNKAEGEYIILLEGDDYWIDPDKLKKQVEFLDRNRDYIAVAHKCLVVDERSLPLPYSYSAECRKDEYTIKDYRKNLLPGQTTTLMYRNIYKKEDVSCDLDMVVDYPGDRRIAFLLVSNGRIKCWNEKMSAYRHVVLNGTSYSATYKEDVKHLQARLEFFRSLYEYSRKYVPTQMNCKVSAQCYYKVLFRDQFRKKAIWPRNTFLKNFMREENKMAIAGWIIYSILYYPIEVGKIKFENYNIKRIHVKNKKRYEECEDERK